jgi:hypothetical protein
MRYCFKQALLELPYLDSEPASSSSARTAITRPDQYTTFAATLSNVSFRVSEARQALRIMHAFCSYVEVSWLER